MNYDINYLISKYSRFINTITVKYNYNENINHLINLLLISFVIKYDIKNEKVIMDCFENTRIIVGDKKKKNEEAFFYRNITFEKEYVSNKYIVINDFNNNYIELIDTMIHEFNHAINSMLNEIQANEDYIFLRTGLSYLTYSKTDLNNAINKSEDYVLEEVINTSQTEDIINIIKEINVDKIDSLEFSNFIVAVKKELLDDKYISKAYFLESKILEPLIKNKTFISTLQKLRFVGEITEIERWFDSIVNKNGTYKQLNSLLKEILDLEVKYISRKIFKKDIEIKLKYKINNVKQIVEMFNNNCIYR